MKVVLYGAGGHGKVILDTVLLNNIRYDNIFLIDDNDKSLLSGIEPFSNNLYRSDFIDPAKNIFAPEQHHFIISIGNNVIRKQLADKVSSYGYSFARAIHPHASIARDTLVGDGSMIISNAVLNAGTTVGKHAIINTGSTVDHDCNIQDYAHIAPGSVLCGTVNVGTGSLIGAGSVCLPKVKIGNWSVIGAGSVVVDNIPDKVIAFGNPCKVIRSIDE